jgi:hypothetical protein
MDALEELIYQLNNIVTRLDQNKITNELNDTDYRLLYDCRMILYKQIEILDRIRCNNL